MRQVWDWTFTQRSKSDNCDERFIRTERDPPQSDYSGQSGWKPSDQSLTTQPIDRSAPQGADSDTRSCCCLVTAVANHTQIRSRADRTKTALRPSCRAQCRPGTRGMGLG